MANKKYRVGLIGYGLSARIFQIPFIADSKDFELGAIVQRSGDSAAHDHPEAKIYRSTEDLLVDETIDVVVVSTPPSTHFVLAAAALNAGKHVIVEKPFCPSTEECNKLIALAKHNQRFLTVFHNRRWDSDYVTLRHILQREILGRIVEFDSHFDRFDPGAPVSLPGKDNSGEGVIYDLGTHLFDQVLQCFGLPKYITGILTTQREGSSGPADACTVLLQYESGMLATIKATAVSALKIQKRFCVRGSTGSFIKYNLDPQEKQLVEGMATGNPDFGNEASEKAGTLTLVKEEAFHESLYPNLPPPKYTAFYDILSDALAGKTGVPVSAKDARNVIRLVELARESSEKGVAVLINPNEFQ